MLKAIKLVMGSTHQQRSFLRFLFSNKDLKILSIQCQ